MSATINLPPQFDPPMEVEGIDYVLEALCPAHNQRDYDAWKSSEHELQGVFGPRDDWPGEVTSIEQNLKDLTKDFREFEQKMAFRYAILSLDKSDYMGCLYIRPTSAEDYDCRFDLWFKNDCKDREAPFFCEIKKWLLGTWGFTKVAFPGREVSWEQYYELTD